jgi:hypothetical protein
MNRSGPAIKSNKYLGALVSSVHIHDRLLPMLMNGQIAVK